MVQVMLGFVAAGLGITLLSASPAIPETRFIVHYSRPLQKLLALAWRRDDPSAVLQAFIEVVRTHDNDRLTTNSFLDYILTLMYYNK